jgi:3-isopropylmalate/(R)-2-methylmalate dehydratase small subunit
MEKLVQLKSKAAVWLIPNIDTDVITPMKRILSNPYQLAEYAFEPYRFINGNADTGELEPGFILNQQQHQNTTIFIVGDNFGCGSSRETAPEAIAGMGIRCLISTSFGGIFFKNCFQQGILPIVFSPEIIDELVNVASQGDFEVDLPNQTLKTPNDRQFSFQIGNRQRQLLLEGLDDVGLTLKRMNSILEYEQSDKLNRPWIYQVNDGTKV